MNFFKDFTYFLGTLIQRNTLKGASVYFNRNALQGSTYFLGKYCSRKYLNLKIPHSKLFQGEYLFPRGSTYLLVNKYCRSS